MKIFVLAMFFIFISAFAFSIPTTNTTPEPQKLSDTEMAEVIGGASCVTWVCERWYWCGGNLCGENCTSTPCIGIQ